MRVCAIVEGAYPYVTGGVSSWLHQLIQSMPDVEFVLQVISAKRDKTREFKYKMLPNVVEVQEVYMLDDLEDPSTKQKIKLKKKDYEAFESLLFGTDVDWNRILTFFSRNNVSVNAILAGYDFFNMVTKYYEANFPGIPFTDFLWTMRSMYLPLFALLSGKPIKADVYHAVSSGYAVVLGSMQKIIYNSPLFLTEHGIYTREREEEIIRASWVDGIYKDLWIGQFTKLGNCGYDYADVVSSLFEDARQFQIELGCDAKKTMVIPNGVDVTRYENIPQKDPDDPYINIGSIGRITPIKDLKTMISAFSNAKEKDDRLKLWVMGPRDEDPEYADECEKLIERLGVQDIVFTGLVNVAEYVGKMDLLLLSSISEGQPLVILEGYAAKKPFVATNVGNCRGLIEGEFDDMGRAGYVVPVTGSTQMAYAILAIAQDDELRQKMGEIGYKRTITYYDKNDIYNRYFQVYDKLVEVGVTKKDGRDRRRTKKNIQQK